MKAKAISWMTFVMCFCWGYEDGAMNTYLFQILGFEFGARSEPYAIKMLLQGLSVFAFDLIQGGVDLKNKEAILIYTGIVGCFSVICAGSVFKF